MIPEIRKKTLASLCMSYAIDGEHGCYEKGSRTRGTPCNCTLSETIKATLKVVIEWFDGKCTKHPFPDCKEVLALINRLCKTEVGWVYEHRYWCPECIREFMESVK